MYKKQKETLEIGNNFLPSPVEDGIYTVRLYLTPPLAFWVLRNASVDLSYVKDLPR